MPQNQLKYKQKPPQSFTGKERDSETGFSYGNAIAKPPVLLHSPLLYYTTLDTQISSGNAIAKTT